MLKELKLESGNAQGIGLGGILLVVFIVLKLCKVIDWSWVWVLSPLWIGAILFVGIVFLVAWLGNGKTKYRINF